MRQEHGTELARLLQPADVKGDVTGSSSSEETSSAVAPSSLNVTSSPNAYRTCYSEAAEPTKVPCRTSVVVVHAYSQQTCRVQPDYR